MGVDLGRNPFDVDVDGVYDDVNNNDDGCLRSRCIYVWWMDDGWWMLDVGCWWELSSKKIDGISHLFMKKI